MSQVLGQKEGDPRLMTKDVVMCCVGTAITNLHGW
jgi:hypothetical protein